MRRKFFLKLDVSKFHTNFSRKFILKVNDIHRETLQFSTKTCQNRIFAASDLFDILTKSMKSYSFNCCILNSTGV